MHALEARSGLLLRLAELDSFDNPQECILLIGSDIEYDIKALREVYGTLQSIFRGEVRAEAARILQAA
jgi:hypothetical protein